MVGDLYGNAGDEDRTIHYGFFRGGSRRIKSRCTRWKTMPHLQFGYEHLPTPARLLPAVRERRPDVMEKGASDPDAERWLLYAAVVAVLRQASSVAPVVLLIEDLHWADRPTLEATSPHIFSLFGESPITHHVQRNRDFFGAWVC